MLEIDVRQSSTKSFLNHKKYFIEKGPDLYLQFKSKKSL